MARDRLHERKRGRFEEEDDDDDDEEFESRRKQQRKGAEHFFQLEVDVSDGDEEEDEDAEDEDFIDDDGTEIPEEEAGKKPNRPRILVTNDYEDVEELERRIHERFGKSSYEEYEEANEVEQQALLPSLKDPKLWRVKCAIGHERKTAMCLMQKYVDSPELQIRSVISLDHLKNYIYIEADKVAHVKEACKGLRNILSYAEVMLVPIKEMPDVLSVENETVELSRDMWVRMKCGIYKGDLARVVDVDNVTWKVTVMLIPRIDLQDLAIKLEVNGIGSEKALPPPPRFFNCDEARSMHIPVREWRDKYSGEHFEVVMDMRFKDGFLYKKVSMKSISSHNIQPTFDELEKFRRSCDVVKGNMSSLSTLLVNRKKNHFLKGDAVIVVGGDLKNLTGWVEKVVEENVHIKPKMEGLPKTLAFNEKELCKYFKPGDHVKVVSGVQEGATGMVVKVESHVLIISSDSTKEDIRVFTDNAVKTSEVSTGITRLGDYELHDLVLLDNMSFGVIIQVESNAFQVLKWDLGRPEVVLVKLSEVKSKIRRHASAQDHFRNIVSKKDIVRVLEGPCVGRQGPVEHIYSELLFIYDRHQQEHAGYICAKAQSCMVVGGLQGNHGKSGLNSLVPRFASLRSLSYRSPEIPPKGLLIDSETRYNGGRRRDPLIGKTIKIRLGPWKGYLGRVKEVKGPLVRVELESQMKVVTVNKNDIADDAGSATSPCDTPRYGMGSGTPMRPCQTPVYEN